MVAYPLFIKTYVYKLTDNFNVFWLNYALLCIVKG